MPAAKYRNGAVERSRTSDLLITNQLLYQLSYNSLEKQTGAWIIEVWETPGKWPRGNPL